MEVLAAFSRTNRFMSAAMALCNEMSTRWQCSRVSLGFLKGRYVEIQAMSDTEKFSRKMVLLQDIETVMEECLDQDVEVLHPAQDTMATVNRAAKQFSNDHGPVALVSVPIRQDGQVRAVMTLERPPERVFTISEIETARLTCDLCASRLLELREHDRWVGARIAASMQKGIKQIFKPKHTLPKFLAASIFLVFLFLTCAKGLYRVESPFKFEATVQQTIVAPFDSYLKSVLVEPGDEVQSGETILGQLELSELRLELAALKAEQLGYQKQAAAAMRDRKTADAQIAQAQSDKVAAQISLMQARLGQGTLVAPITGRIISEDLKRQIGAPVETGAVLFEIAHIESLRAELYVPEDAISDVIKGQEGELVSVSHPNQKIPFVVERINPMADVVNQHNVFKVRAKLLSQHQWMRPGMEGVAKISVGKEPYVWIGSRRLVNWLRMKLWV
ncbi:MAG: HlyD family efflux transporter periplasmic adaptor subunit [Deltaproteobacteria bacterium]|nr:HlyD family efflux transporter periplasmic adaptor subunit [Deltaproteobacteria bacterium]